uniref:Uncharacterized protein n=1 Tax=Moniliophthora roreri TaxID=221103 RepID=A0A0W0FDU1_MONRR
MGIYISPPAQVHIASTVQSLFYGMIHANFVLHILIQTAHGGAFIVSFGICMNILLKRRKGHYQYHLLATAILFILVSANFLVYMTYDAVKMCFYGSNPVDESNRCWLPTTRFFDAQYETALASSSVADAILLWRCYVVWGKRRKIMILPAFLYVAAHVVGLVLASSDVVVMGNWFGYDEKTPLSPISVVAVSAGVGLVSTTIIIRVTLGNDNMESTVVLSRATNIEDGVAARVDISPSAINLKQEGTSEWPSMLEHEFDGSSRSSGNAVTVD